MNTYLSVIIPVYNREATLETCTRSVLNQTYRPYELICVDDGSNDNSSLLLDKLVSLNDNIVVIHQCNAGVSSARNTGLLVATGDYITFVDSDDFVDKDIYSVMMSFGIENNLDCIGCGFRLRHRYKNKEIFSDFDNKVIFGAEEVHSRIVLPMLGFSKQSTGDLGGVFNKVYRKSVLDNNHIFFNTRRAIAEDWQFNLEFFKVCESFGYVRQAMYHYVRRGGETQVLAYDPKWFRQVLEDHEWHIRTFPELDWDMPSKAISYYLTPIVAMAYYRDRIGKNKKELIKKMDEIWELSNEYLRNCNTEMLADSEADCPKCDLKIINEYMDALHRNDKDCFLNTLWRYSNKRVWKNKIKRIAKSIVRW